MIKKNLLVTFSDGHYGWRQAANRIVRSAKYTNLFDQTVSLDLAWLKEYDPKLFSQICNLIKHGDTKGLGYWMWKPAVLKWASENYPNYQILYIDAGFDINSTQNLIKEFENFLKSNWSLGSCAFSQASFVEKYWTKKEVLNYFNSSSLIRSSDQVYAGFILIAPSKDREIFIKDYYEATRFDKGFLFNDTFRLNQIDGFIQHRHDQSILSCIWKKMNLNLESELVNYSNYGKFLMIAARNRTGLPVNAGTTLLKSARFYNHFRERLFSRSKLTIS